MAKVILICGRVCAGKTHYATEHFGKAVLLSCDELSLTLFPEGLGERHDEVMKRAHSYLLSLAERLNAAGQDVVLDWGFWSKRDREETSEYFRLRGVEYEWHYVTASAGCIRRNAELRNAGIAAGTASGYFADEGLLRKCSELFEEPENGEMDVIVVNEE